MASLALSPQLDETHRLLSRGGVRLLVRRDWESSLPIESMLAGAPLSAWGVGVPHALSGRGPVHVLATSRGEIVAKQLQRGGLLGGLLRNRFFDARRPLREAEAAELLVRRGVRTPALVAARITRRALGLCLEVATAREAGVDLLAAARSDAALATLGVALGRTLRAAHAAGLRHRDLQVKNLFVPSGFPGPGGAGDPVGLVILDLDRCSVGDALEDSERRAALVRLGRSLVKRGILPVAGAASGRRVSPALWACRAFIRAYEAHSSSGAALLAEVARGLRRQLGIHRWVWSRPGR